MSNQATLEQVIQKAIDGGWQYDGRLPIEYFSVPGDGHWIYFGYEDTKYPDLSLNDLVFRHDFAKALWGDGRYTERREGNETIRVEHRKDWRRHLQAMVIAEDPIKYLGDNL